MTHDLLQKNRDEKPFYPAQKKSSLFHIKRYFQNKLIIQLTTKIK